MTLLVLPASWLRDTTQHATAKGNHEPVARLYWLERLLPYRGEFFDVAKLMNRGISLESSGNPAARRRCT